MPTDTNNLDFKLLSLNVRGLRDFKKRKTIINWIMKQKADIIFLQETYSTPDIVTHWKYQWKGNMYFSHGSNKSKGVLILIKKDIEFKLKNIKIDTNGRFIVAQCEIQNSPFVLTNVYASNITEEQVDFFHNIEQLESLDFDPDSNIVIGGDFNVTFTTDLDCSGGKPIVKKSVKALEELKLNHDLVDIWRIRNPNTKKFTWRQKTPFVQRRLDF